MKLPIFVLLLCSFQFSFAYGLSGNWAGQGQLKINGQIQDQPCQMTLNIEHTESTFCVLKSEFKCPGMNIVNKKQTVLQIKDGQLLNGETVLGTISETQMYSQSTMPDGRRSEYLMELKDATQLFYKDSVEWYKGYVTEVEGVLN
jgi:hypothetical protein